MRSEWAEIYSKLNSDIDSYTKDILLLNNENDKLLQLTSSKPNNLALTKKLGKRELECSALWDTIRDLYKGHSNPIDKSSLSKLFQV
eukprot:CAMPEP_0205804816 /NCGR_PEP_ID=MMETSP0205-20121125/7851_1 /ASSEMBLY_ACC=CAM_ASM_000278 /TAXON_ID=36767 /ORGANISM="Euplotes focardii, Strain TN1" /LENGTH=86 /DNA_ID=CAMNT_0053075035 /DNA_START=405 /DNA_END=661 /DNA_ORIENTATION=-